MNSRATPIRPPIAPTPNTACFIDPPLEPKFPFHEMDEFRGGFQAGCRKAISIFATPPRTTRTRRDRASRSPDFGQARGLACRGRTPLSDTEASPERALASAADSAPDRA